MFKHPSHSRHSLDSGPQEFRQPLLHSRDHVETVFTTGDDSDEELEGTSALETRKVSFKEDIQLVAPPLRSTTSSREARQ